MKRLLFYITLFGLVMLACESHDQESTPQEPIAVDMSDFYLFTDDELSSKSNAKANLDRCHSMVVLNRQLLENPGLYQKMYAIEEHTRRAIAAKKPSGTPGGGNGGGGNGGGGGGGPVIYDLPVTIPVVVNIIELNPNDVTQSQIDTQIDILNEDYGNKNPNTSGAPTEFASLVANVNITFDLKTVNRKTSSIINWSPNNSMKYGSEGIIATDPTENLNIWVVNNMTSGSSTILGYAQFPGGTTATDGIVLGKNFFGEVPNGPFGGVYGDGRTATHEVGHWLNLRHIWGDGRCKQDDFVADTPNSDRPNNGCPTGPVTHCRSRDMTMNYMDYVYDDCMYMFTLGQNDRMRALFASGGARESLVIP